MALFEHIIMLRQDLSSSDLEEAIKVHEQTLGELDGNVVYKESWGLRSLAYPIKENKKAFYEFMNIEQPQDKIDTLNSKLNLNDKIIRYLSVKVKEFCELIGSSKTLKEEAPHFVRISSQQFIKEELFSPEIVLKDIRSLRIFIDLSNNMLSIFCTN